MNSLRHRSKEKEEGLIKATLYNFILIGLGLVILTGCLPSPAEPYSTSELRIERQNKDDLTFYVEIADNEEARAQGLMNREEIPSNYGMLFVFPDETFRSFWMKNTLIPLDILFINRFGKIVHIHHHAIPHDLTGIPSQMPAMYALEINGGQASILNIQIGDKVFHDKIKRTLAE